MDNEKGWIALFWSMIGLGILAVIFSTGKVESDLAGRVNAALHESGYDWASIKESSGRNLVLIGQSPIKAAQKRALDTARDVYGVRRVDDETRVREPASPYAWSATVNQNEIILAGNVPDERTKAMIAKKAESLATGRKITDRTTLADGAPGEGWEENIAFALDQAKNIKNGAVLLVDQTVTVEGTTWNSADAKALTGTAAAVAGYKLTTKVKSPAMMAREETAGSEKTDTRSEVKLGKATSSKDKSVPDQTPAKTAASSKPSTVSSAGKVTDTVAANSKTAQQPDADQSDKAIGSKKAGQTQVAAVERDDSNKEAAATTNDHKKDKQGFMGKALTAIKSMGSNDKDKAKDAAKADSEEKPAPSKVAKSDGTENGAVKPVASEATKASDLAAASSKSPSDAGAPSGGGTGDVAGTSPQGGNIDTKETASPIKAAEPAADTAQPTDQKVGSQTNRPDNRGVQAYRRAYVPVPRVMLAPAWVRPPWVGGPYGPVYRPYPVCPWGPAFCPPVW